MMAKEYCGHFSDCDKCTDGHDKTCRYLKRGKAEARKEKDNEQNKEI